MASAVPPPPSPATADASAASSVSPPAVDELRRRAEKAELALRALATQHAERTAELLHQIETLKRELAEARAAGSLSKEAVLKALAEWSAERRRRLEEEIADLTRRLGVG
ncbi:MAG: hypothetical protein N2652_02970 [Kiritimatiellae bacterium]|nr:hypothetical protein [Kiritimatiellia bacterium]